MTDNIDNDTREVFVYADGTYYGPFTTVDAANAFARTRTDAHLCHLDLCPAESLEATCEEYELICIDPPIL
jgi:hypothetical protein